MNKLAPGAISKINTSGAQFKMMENIQKYLNFTLLLSLLNCFLTAHCLFSPRFQKAAIAYGVNEIDVFQTVDLWEKKDISQVTTTLFGLGRTVSRLFQNFKPQQNPLYKKRRNVCSNLSTIIVNIYTVFLYM